MNYISNFISEIVELLRAMTNLLSGVIVLIRLLKLPFKHK
jgi:hypothetical protein